MNKTINEWMRWAATSQLHPLVIKAVKRTDKAALYCTPRSLSDTRKTS
jgi:hypothetical protein